MRIKQTKVSKKLNREIEIYTDKYLRWCSVATDEQIENVAKNKFKEEFLNGELGWMDPKVEFTKGNFKKHFEEFFKKHFEEWDETYAHRGSTKEAKEIRYLIKSGNMYGEWRHGGSLLSADAEQRFTDEERLIIIDEVENFLYRFEPVMEQTVFNSAKASLHSGDMEEREIEKILDFMKVANLAKKAISGDAMHKRLKELNAPDSILQGATLNLIQLEQESEVEMRRIMKSSKTRDNIASLISSDYFSKFGEFNSHNSSPRMHSFLIVSRVIEVLNSQDDIYNSRKIVDGCAYAGKRR